MDINIGIDGIKKEIIPQSLSISARFCFCSHCLSPLAPHPEKVAMMPVIMRTVMMVVMMILIMMTVTAMITVLMITNLI